jgi:hypothetical protein
MISARHRSGKFDLPNRIIRQLMDLPGVVDLREKNWNS